MRFLFFCFLFLVGCASHSKQNSETRPSNETLPAQVQDMEKYQPWDQVTLEKIPEAWQEMQAVDKVPAPLEGRSWGYIPFVNWGIR